MIVGDRKMKELNSTYLDRDNTTSVLAFAQMGEGEVFYYSPSDRVYLGDIVISYPQLIARACESTVRVDKEMEFLLEHGVKNLIGLGEGRVEV